MIVEIERKFGKMTVQHGYLQMYLGMNIENKNKHIHMELKDCLHDCINFSMRNQYSR